MVLELNISQTAKAIRRDIYHLESELKIQKERLRNLQLKCEHTNATPYSSQSEGMMVCPECGRSYFESDED